MEASTLLKDYRPISLIHSFAKLATKVMALRLTPSMGELVSRTQTSFIKGRSIHENFIFVQVLTRQFHRQRKAMKAMSAGLLDKVNHRNRALNNSLYADDAVIFLKPVRHEAMLVKAVLDLFGEATDLLPNFSKSVVSPIRCTEEQRSLLPKWAIKDIKRRCRGFLWKGQEEVNGGHCLVAWRAVCMPVEFGGLGIKDIELFGKALRLKWEFNRLEHEDRPWTMANWESDKDVRNIFSSIAQHMVGDGCRINFWRGNWLPRGGSIANNWPILFSFVGRTKIVVAQGLTNNRWVRHLQGSLSNRALADYLNLWDELQLVSLQDGQLDSVLWRFTASGAFSVSSPYEFFFYPSVKCSHGALIWKTKAPARVRFFLWLAAKGRCLTADNLSKRGWPHDTTCTLCRAAPEDCIHLFTKCSFTNRVWQLLRTWLNVAFPLPDQLGLQLAEWWLSIFCMPENKGCNEEEVLESLKPHAKLKILELHGYSGLKIPQWMKDPQLLQCLTNLHISNCPGCKDLSTVWFLVSLEGLFLSKMKNLTTLFMNVTGVKAEGYYIPLQIFPRLKDMTLRQLSNLEKWTENTAGEADTILVTFPELAKLCIFDCPKLASIPDCPVLKELNSARRCSLAMGSLAHLTTLSELIYEDNERVRMSLGSWPSLTKLDVSSSYNKMSTLEVDTNQGPLENLRSLMLYRLKCFTDAFGFSKIHLGPWKCFAFVEDLPISGCDGLVRWPTEELMSLIHLRSCLLKSAVTLRERVHHRRMCYDLKKLPDGMDGLISLEELKIWNCREIEKFSQGLLQRLPTLKELLLWGCPSLQRLCREGAVQETTLSGVSKDNYAFGREGWLQEHSPEGHNQEVCGGVGISMTGAMLQGFLEVVQESWHRSIFAINPIAVFSIKLCRLARDLKRWNKRQVGDIALQFAVATVVIFQLDVAQESRSLSDEERLLISNLKSRVLGLAMLNKIKIRQWSRLTWIQEGDVNSKFFHLKANSRRRKNFIQSLQTPTGIAVTNQDKEEELYRFSKKRLGTNFQRSVWLNWTSLQIPSADLADLEGDISEEEPRNTIFEMPSEKAPGPDGFIGAFYKSAWEITKGIC
uniref:Uncharacterized protein n=1 Tax=Oryza meridionalis TaxID=40149 RepID=A0A0E0DYK4_9ORYZ